MKKNLAMLTALAAVAVSGLLGTGCANNKAPAQKPTKLTILSDRDCIPPPYASPSQHSFRARGPEAKQPPAAVKDSQGFVPAPSNDGGFTPAMPGQPGDAPVFTPAADVPAPKNVAGKGAPKVAPQQPASKPAAKPARTHTVKKGEYLSTIAYKYGVSTKDLAAVNNMEINATLRIGRVLMLPENALATPRQIQSKAKNAAPKAAPGKAADAKQGKAGEAKMAPVDKNIYIVKAGDIFSKIVQSNNVNAKDVRALNPHIKDFSKLKVGDKIRLRPSLSSAKAAPAAGGNKNAAPDAAAPAAPEPKAEATEGSNAEGPAPAIKPVKLSRALNYNTLPLTPTGEATAE